LNIYVAPLYDIYSVLPYMMLNVIMKEYITPVSETMHSKLSDLWQAHTHTRRTNQLIPKDRWCLQSLD